MNSTEVWISDDGTLRESAIKLVKAYSNILGPLQLEKVVFFRVVGCKQPWKGKTWRLTPPYNYVPFAASQVLADVTLPNDFEISFVIAISDSKHDLTKQSDVLYTLLHELYHIKPDMLGLKDHDIKEHYWMLKEFGLDKELANAIVDVVNGK